MASDTSVLSFETALITSDMTENVDYNDLSPLFSVKHLLGRHPTPIPGRMVCVLKVHVHVVARFEPDR